MKRFVRKKYSDGPILCVSNRSSQQPSSGPRAVYIEELLFNLLPRERVKPLKSYRFKTPVVRLLTPPGVSDLLSNSPISESAVTRGDMCWGGHVSAL